MMQTVIACVITAVVALIIGIPIGIQIRKRTAEKEINSAEEEAKRIINESIKSAESKKRERWWRPRRRFSRPATSMSAR